MDSRPTLYVCGPMTGLPGLNFRAFFEADKQLRDCGYEVLNPADRAGRTEGMPWSWYLRRCIKDVADSDGVALLTGWDKSKGAALERHIAQQLNMPIRTVSEWMDDCPTTWN